MTGADELARERSGVQMINPAPYNAEALPGALVAEITPTALHYIRSNFALPEHDGTLTVGGAVENPMSLTLDSLRALPAYERAVARMRGQRAPRDASAADRLAMGRRCRLDGALDGCPAA